MGNADSISMVSQVNSLDLVIRGHTLEAEEVQENCEDCDWCPCISNQFSPMFNSLRQCRGFEDSRRICWRHQDCTNYWTWILCQLCNCWRYEEGRRNWYQCYQDHMCSCCWHYCSYVCTRSLWSDNPELRWLKGEKHKHQAVVARLFSCIKLNRWQRRSYG